MTWNTAPIGRGVTPLKTHYSNDCHCPLYIPEELKPPQLEAFDSMDDKTTPESFNDLPPPQLEVFRLSEDKSMPDSPPAEEQLPSLAITNELSVGTNLLTVS